MANSNSLDGYYAAINWLSDHRPHMVDYITALGLPQNDLRTKRAMVVAGRDLKPKLYANDEFLQKIGPAQAAGVLVHEWRHVLLNHFSESFDPKPTWRYEQVLSDAHEAIINDHIELAGYELPGDCVRGSNRGGRFYGYWTTDEAYGPMEDWYLSQQEQQQSPQGNPKNEQDDSDSSNSEDGDQSDSSDGESGNSGSSDQSSSQDQSEGGDESQEDGGSGEGQDSDSSEGSDGSEGSNPGGSSSSPQNGGKASDSPSDGQSDEDSQPGDTSGQQDGSSAGDSSSDDSSPSEAADQSSSDSSSSTADSSNDGSPQDDGSCDNGTGLVEDDNGDLREMTKDELEDFLEELNRRVADAIRQQPMPDDEKPEEGELDTMDQEVAEAIDPSRSQGYSKAGTASAAEKVLAGGKLHMGWLKLLQRINPNVGKEDGGINSKAAYNWARPRRSTSLIRGANLPSPGAPRDRGAGGKLRPTVLIALDFSMSIDRRLAHAMKDMAQSIPQQHIEARCFTFSTVAIPFDFKASSNSTASGGTDFSCIEVEARKIQKQTGEYPYVMCLTDGQAWFGGGYGGATGLAPTSQHLKDRWLWVDVLTEDDDRAFITSTAFPQVKVQANKSALPYDRSKL